jgi:uncharacterized membrane protein YedE/YeeE
MKVLLQFVIGLIFGLGLVIAGMSNPAKVLNFLDIAAIPAGSWDASLAFVLIGAIAVTFVGFRLVLRRSRPLFGDQFHLPTAKELDARVIIGPAIFGIGWGLAGLCPGPAFTALGTGSVAGIGFVAAMLIGMVSARWLASRQAVARVIASQAQ